MKRVMIVIGVLALIGGLAFGQETESLAAPEGMVLVPAGTFMMGSVDGWEDEQPVHEVTISKSYYMGKYEVTQAEWAKVMGSNPSYFKGDNLPVECVSWNDVIDYCNKRSKAEGLTPCYRVSGDTVYWDFSANGYRLPTEAEWEWAARGAGKGRLDYEYGGSNDIDAVAWYDENSGWGTHPVGQKQANSLGIYDMSGNVSEWCWDLYGASRVLRGGSWNNDAWYVRSADRSDSMPDIRYVSGGFRLVHSL